MLITLPACANVCLQCKAARCADVAATIRRQLAQAVPARLLLPPVLAHLDMAAEVCPPLACSAQLASCKLCLPSTPHSLHVVCLLSPISPPT